jgi:hypothetical protein
MFLAMRMGHTAMKTILIYPYAEDNFAYHAQIHGIFSAYTHNDHTRIGLSTFQRQKKGMAAWAMNSPSLRGGS